MFLRSTRRFKDGKEHRYWSIVENRRCAGGKVVQRPVLYLGEINDSQKQSWCRVLEGFDETQGQNRQMALFPWDRQIPVHAVDIGIGVRLKDFSLHRPRQWGACWLVRGDLALLKQAMLHDPLTAAVCNPEEVWQMGDEMLIAQRRWLPQYEHEIKRASARLRKHGREGTRVRLFATKGAARLKTRSLKEIAKNRTAARANAAAADKGNLTGTGRALGVGQH